MHNILQESVSAHKSKKKKKKKTKPSLNLAVSQNYWPKSLSFLQKYVEIKSVPVDFGTSQILVVEQQHFSYASSSSAGDFDLHPSGAVSWQRVAGRCCSRSVSYQTLCWHWQLQCPHPNLSCA